jgi:hypothetical protein
LAAQNLTFLKMGTPSPSERKEASAKSREDHHQHADDKQELQSIPSLVASSSGEATIREAITTSPILLAVDNTNNNNVKDDDDEEDQAEAGGMDSLLMAAMAMTGEFAGVDKKTKLSAVKTRLHRNERMKAEHNNGGTSIMIEPAMKRSPPVDSPTNSPTALSRKKRLLSPVART